MEGTKKLPIGIESFEEIRTEGFYYVDKTGLIGELLNNWGKVNLFTRPRRFGKSLNMSMLRYFFEYGCDTALFDGLHIMEDQELCGEYMGAFPVISITLKDVSATDYEAAKAMLCSELRREVRRFQFLKDSAKLTDIDKDLYYNLARVSVEGEVMTEEVLTGSLQVLSQLLQKHFGQKVILLLDEYDVPLDKAQQYHYYNEMLLLVRNLLAKVLKSNDSLYFAVLTGCLRISKESIFTGLNNMQVMTITDKQYNEYFGFTDAEVRTMLDYYGASDKYQLTKEWYDGYRFGDVDVYCPWDVINYCAKLRSDQEAVPRPFWVNTSENSIIRRFLSRATMGTRRELEQLMNGESVAKKINMELTYRDLYQSMDNMWSVLYATGYLTVCENPKEDLCQLVIPNLEIRKIFTEQIMEWFREETAKDTPQLDAFCTAFQKVDAETIEDLLNAYLRKTISIRDTSVQTQRKENFYHGILLGLLSHREEWDVYSNAESGEGYSDIMIETEENLGIVIEIKYRDDGDLEAGCREALEQIEKRKYAMKLYQDGMTAILKYGIACCKKSCKVQGYGTVRSGEEVR